MIIIELIELPFESIVHWRPKEYCGSLKALLVLPITQNHDILSLSCSESEIAKIVAIWAETSLA